METQILILLFFLFLSFINLMIENKWNYFAAGASVALASDILYEIIEQL